MPLHNTLRIDLSKLTFLQFRYNERRSDLVKICSMVHITLRPGENHEQKRARRFSHWKDCQRGFDRQEGKATEGHTATMTQLTFVLPRALIAFPNRSQTIQAPFHGCSSSLPGTLQGLFGESTTTVFLLIFLCHTCLHYHTLGCCTLHDRDPTVRFLYLVSLCSSLYSQMTSTSPMVLNAIYACMALKFTSATHLCPLSSSLLSPNLMMIPLGCTMCVSNCI